MPIEREDVFRASRLIHWGLQPKLRPVQAPEYAELVQEYLNRGDFRELVEEVADGLGLYVLDVSEHGIVLSPHDDSVFLFKTADFRPGSSRAEDRLLDGLAQLAIAATVFPRAADLEDDLDRPRPPLTVEEVEDLLRVLSERLEEENRDKPDPAVSDEAGGLLEAWRIYRRRAAAKDERFSRIGMRRIIEFGLERLRDFGCFVETQLGGKSAWQPTRRYNVMVQEFAASRLLEEVQRVLGYNAPMDEED